MKTALLSIIENAFVGTKPHEATFTLLTLEDGSTAPLGRIERVAVPNKEAALDWAAKNSIRVMTEFKARILRSDGTVTPVTLSIQDGLAPGSELNNELASACTRLRNADPAVASVRVEVLGFEKPYRWMGNYTAEHMDAVTAREKNGTDNW